MLVKKVGGGMMPAETGNFQINIYLKEIPP